MEFAIVAIIILFILSYGGAINSKKLYDYARSGVDVELPKRMVNIKSIELIDFKDNILKYDNTEIEILY